MDYRSIVALSGSGSSSRAERGIPFLEDNANTEHIGGGSASSRWNPRTTARFDSIRSNGVVGRISSHATRQADLINWLKEEEEEGVGE